MTDYSSRRLPGARRPPLGLSVARIVAGIAVLTVLFVGLAMLARPFMNAFGESQFWFGLVHFEQYLAAVQRAESDRLIRLLGYGSLLIASLLAAIFLVVLAMGIARDTLGIIWIGVRDLVRPHWPGQSHQNISEFCWGIEPETPIQGGFEAWGDLTDERLERRTIDSKTFCRARRSTQRDAKPPQTA